MTSYKRCIVIKTPQPETEFKRHNLYTIILLDCILSKFEFISIFLFSSYTDNFIAFSFFCRII